MGDVKFVTAAFVFIALLGGLVGCSMDRWEGVNTGKYVVAPGGGFVNQVGQQIIQIVEVDKQNDQVSFYFVDGSEIAAAFVPRDKADWPAGCPTNIHMTHMEVLDLEADTLTIGSNTFREPILIRDCPRNPERIVLRSDGEMGGSGTACTASHECIYFMRR